MGGTEEESPFLSRRENLQISLKLYIYLYLFTLVHLWIITCLYLTISQANLALFQTNLINQRLLNRRIAHHQVDWFVDLSEY